MFWEVLSNASEQIKDLKIGVTVKEEVKCLGYKLKGSLSLSSTIVECQGEPFSNLAVFILAFQRNLSPLSFSSIFQMRVLPNPALWSGKSHLNLCGA